MSKTIIYLLSIITPIVQILLIWALIEVLGLHKVWNSKIKYKGTFIIPKKMGKKPKIMINHPKTNKRKSGVKLKFVEVNIAELDYIQHNEIELTYEIMVLTKRLNTMPKTHKNGLKGSKIIRRRLSLLNEGVKAYESDNEMEIKAWRNKNMRWLEMNSGFGQTHFPNRNLNYK
jgi:membrane glycosyltransferase